MQAAFIEEFGPAEVIRYGELPAPRPGPHEVVVQVAATTVNHVDTFIRSGAVRTPLDFPFIVGRDVVGTVAELGGGVGGFAIGDQVWCNSLGHGGRQGAAAERVVVPVDRLYRLPAGASIEAVTVLHPGATAYLAVITHGQTRAGQTLVIIGAAGNVGSAAVRIAKTVGARVIAVARRRHAAYCASLGADLVLDSDDPSCHDQLAAAAPDGVDVYLDAAGANDLPTAVGQLKMRGRIVVLAGLHTHSPLPVGELYIKDGSILGFTITHAQASELADAAIMINQLLATGQLRSQELRTLPLSATAEAHRLVEAGELHRARVLLTVG